MDKRTLADEKVIKTLIYEDTWVVLKFIKNLNVKSRKLPSDDQSKSEIKNILLADEEIEASQTISNH